MSDLSIVKGSSIKNEKKIIKEIVSDLKKLESSINEIKRLTEKIGWTNLSTKIKECHINIVESLKFSKELCNRLEIEKPKTNFTVINGEK